MTVSVARKYWYTVSFLIKLWSLYFCIVICVFLYVYLSLPKLFCAVMDSWTFAFFILFQEFLLWMDTAEQKWIYTFYIKRFFLFNYWLNALHFGYMSINVFTKLPIGSSMFVSIQIFYNFTNLLFPVIKQMSEVTMETHFRSSKPAFWDITS